MYDPKLRKHYWRVVKKHSRKSISWHKRRILARFHPKDSKRVKIEIVQHTTHSTRTANKRSILCIYIIDKYERTPQLLTRHPVQEHFRVMKALRYLVAEEKIKSDMTTKEWDVQLALGTAEKRKFTTI
ncbi:hypothetical protein LCGC14_1776450 [marine sediment metagenome]|uniref:Uncharacterized protein n=1 Tax=marine sediment metagenome TaxID=412755 RepID=A0A0F9HJ93_9ZZZZ